MIGKPGEVWVLGTNDFVGEWYYILIERDRGFRGNMWRAMRLQDIANVHTAGTIGQLNLDSINVRKFT